MQKKAEEKPKPQLDKPVAKDKVPYYFAYPKFFKSYKFLISSNFRQSNILQKDEPTKTKPAPEKPSLEETKVKMILHLALTRKYKALHPSTHLKHQTIVKLFAYFAER